MNQLHFVVLTVTGRKDLKKKIIVLLSYTS